MARVGPYRRVVSALAGRVPTWQGNLMVFGLLIALVLAYFFAQVRQAHRTFLGHVQQNTGIIAGVIKQNARSAVLSQQVVGEIILTFLESMARFVDYLDRVEPFSDHELSAFAAEAGLAGIRISRTDGTRTQGPAGWVPSGLLDCSTGSPAFLRHFPDSRLYALQWAASGAGGCIVVGIASGRIDHLQQQIGLTRLLENISSQAGIAYARMETDPGPAERPPDTPGVVLIHQGDRQVAETRLSLGADRIVVGIDARPFFVRVQGLWREFFVFSAIFGGFGVFLSWVLFRLQAAHLKEVRDYERALARQHEDAALGRAAAAIAHEIGNPLNAMGMGLQRLRLEADTLDEEHRELVATMLGAVDRTRGIISGIRRYAKPLAPARDRVDLTPLVEQILGLYRQTCRRQGIAVTFSADSPGSVIGDRQLLGEVVENLVKNGVEAQPGGGRLAVSIRLDGQTLILSVENDGLNLPPAEAQRIFDPYFTTKSRGTGLGLSIAKRIVNALNGRLVMDQPRDGSIRLRVLLTAAGPQDPRTSGTAAGPER